MEAYFFSWHCCLYHNSSNRRIDSWLRPKSPFMYPLVVTGEVWVVHLNSWLNKKCICSLRHTVLMIVDKTQFYKINNAVWQYTFKLPQSNLIKDKKFKNETRSPTLNRKKSETRQCFIFISKTQQHERETCLLNKI